MAAVPSVPQDVSVELPRALLDGTLSVSWEPSSGQPVTYKVQWRSPSQEFSSSRQHEVLGIRRLDGRRATVLKGLNDRTEYAVRVLATNDHGDSPPSPEVTGTSLSGHVRYRRFVRAVVKEYGRNHPWLQATWDHMEQYGVEIVVDENQPGHGYVTPQCWSYASDALAGCRIIRMGTSVYDWRNKGTVLHELAHVYTVTTNISDRPAPLAMAFVYFHKLCESKQHSVIYQCPSPRELFADIVTLNTVSNSISRTPTSVLMPYAPYWYGGMKILEPLFPEERPKQARDDPGHDTSQLGYSAVFEKVRKAQIANARMLKAALPEARALVRTALNGQVPQWFTTTYHDTAGKPDLKRFWVDVRKLPVLPRQISVNQLSGAFGGYCDNQEASESAFLERPTTNPWRDGGCVPGAPAGLEVAHDAKGIAVSWTAPADHGVSPVQGYRVRRRHGSRPYHPTHEMIISDPTQRTHVIGLVPSGVHTLEVTAFNSHGEGVGTIATVTVPDRVAPKLSRVTSEGLELLLRYGEALHSSSVPPASAFRIQAPAVSVSDVFRAPPMPALRVAAVYVSVNVVILTLKVTETEMTVPTSSDQFEYRLSYSVPQGSSVAPIRDVAGNPARGFSNLAVTVAHLEDLADFFDVR